MRTLLSCWNEAIARMQKSTPPALIYEEESRAVSVIRDIFTPEFENIYVNDPETLEQIKHYVSLIAPESKEIVKEYNKPTPILALPVKLSRVSVKSYLLKQAPTSS